MSQSGTIADGFVAGIEGLALAGTPPVRKRKQATLHERDPDLVVFVWVGDGERLEPLGDFGAGLAFLVAYPAGVAVVARNKGKLGDNEAVRVAREAVRDRFVKPGDLAGVNDIEPDGKSVFDLSGLGKGLDWAELAFKVTVIEP